MQNPKARADDRDSNRALHGQINLYAVFHLNLMYSSIEEDEHKEVIQKCYWPLLRLIGEYDLPLGIEVSGYTLERVADLDADWVDELRRLTTAGVCEFIGSGYAQLIGPLVPAEVNAANLRLGNQAYEGLLGFRPKIALVAEQTYSAGMIQHYLDAGYRAIIMEWDNPARYHSQWKPEWRYLPQLACSQHGEEIPLIWNKSIAFQKFQRYAHGEMELNEYLNYLSSHIEGERRAFCFYGNDIEIFNFRPGRYHTEASLYEDEWRRIGLLFESLLADNRFHFIRPRQVLDLLQVPGAGNRLHLESPEEPIPVKKQGKYNVTRWAVTGRNDIGINTACWRICEALKADPTVGDNEWRELCYLWSSDFRTHITEKRWGVYRKRLAVFEGRIDANTALEGSSAPMLPENGTLQAGINVTRNGRYLDIETDAVKARLNCRRGLAIDGLWFKGVSDQPLVGTLHHGHYGDISLGADYYTGHLILESPGQPKVTDLNPVEPKFEDKDLYVDIAGTVSTPLGLVHKFVRVFKSIPRVEIEYRLDWQSIPISSLRIGHITLNPAAFEHKALFYRTHNGGFEKETFYPLGANIDHGRAVSFLVSANQAVGITNGVIELGDDRRCLRIDVDKTAAALVGLVTYREVDNSYFFRLGLSASEVDETTRASLQNGFGRTFRIGIEVMEIEKEAKYNNMDSKNLGLE